MLAPEGCLLVTFNNHDTRAWIALLDGTQRAGLVCQKVDYQIPAVISSKAQFSPDASYLGDLYMQFVPGKGLTSLEVVKDQIVERLILAAASRGNRITESLCRRTLVQALLELNVQARDFDSAFELLDDIFDADVGSRTLKNEHEGRSQVQLSDLIRQTSRGFLEKNPATWSELYSYLAASLASFGLPEMVEIRDATKDLVVEKSGRVFLRQDADFEVAQLVLEIH